MNFKKYHVSRNLFDSTILQNNKGVSSNGNIIDQSGRIATVTPINVSGYSAVTLTYAGDNVSFIYATFNSGTLVERVAGKESGYTINTTNCDLLYICFYGSSAITKDDVSNIMLNLGSEALPYEPYSSEVWHDTPHYIHNTSTDTITTLPAVLYPNDATATVGLKGQAVRSGTPTPQNPIMPQGCGERTGNVIDYTQSESGGIDGNGNYVASSNLWRSTVFTPIDSLQYFISWTEVTSFIAVRINYYTAERSHISREQITATGTALTIPQNAAYFKWTLYATTGTKINLSYVESLCIMLNLGSTALPYEPYGFEIPISSAGQTTPIYLGETQTTRRIKKLVLTGEETIDRADNCFRIPLPLSSASIPNAVSTHLPFKAGWELRSGATGICTSTTYYGTNYKYLLIRCDEIATTITNYKSYLRQQYAAGTPVCVWYVLETEETAVVNEPLMKIGDYADEVANVSIPITAGGDTLSVGTTVQPSEVTVNYKGWHPVADVHEKSINLAPPFSDWVAGYIDVNGNIHNPSNPSAEKSSDFIEVSPNTDYTFSYETGTFPSVDETYTAWRAVCQYDENKNSLGRTGGIGNGLTLTTASNCKYVRLSYRTYSQTKNTMLNSGSTALPYEPYWK